MDEVDVGFWSTESVPNVRDLLRGVRPGSRVSGLIDEGGTGQTRPLRGLRDGFGGVRGWEADKKEGGLSPSFMELA